MKEQETERKCIVSGEVKPKEDLLRFTLTPDGNVVPDLKKKLPGKGVYVSCSKALLEQAVAKNLFTKAFKQKAKAESGLANLTGEILRKTGLESVNLARKAGVMLGGFDKIIEALRKGKILFLLEATDAGADGHEKMLSAAKGLKVFALYDTKTTDEALGKINAVHSAFVKSDMADKAYSDFLRIENFYKTENK